MKTTTQFIAKSLVNSCMLTPAMVQEIVDQLLDAAMSHEMHAHAHGKCESKQGDVLGMLADEIEDLLNAI